MFWLAVERESVAISMITSNLIPRTRFEEVAEALLSLVRRKLVIEESVIVMQSVAGRTYRLHNVVMEYTTERFISLLSAEIISGPADLLVTHSIIKAQAKDYVRQS